MRKLVPAVVAITLVSTAAIAGVKSVNGVEVRDWEAIDSNDDSHISAEEMETFLREVRAARERKSES
jgi:hypothetical protein